jgi:quercetin dioxygenase-like cupin family protein
MNRFKSMTRLIGLGSAVAGIALALSQGRADAADQVEMVFEHNLPNAEGKKLIAVLVNYPPGAKSLPHHHAASAFVFAYVVAGSIRSQIDGEPVRIYGPGESFYEVPGTHHRVSENASDTISAKLLAVFVVDSRDGPLTVPEDTQ